MHQYVEADAFLHEGLRHNPGSYDILFELGRLYDEDYHDTNRARNVWEQAERAWRNRDEQEQKENRLVYEQITTHLGQLEADAGNTAKAIKWFEQAKSYSLTPDALQQQIAELKAKLARPPAGTTNSIHQPGNP